MITTHCHRIDVTAVYLYGIDVISVVYNMELTMGISSVKLLD